MKKALVTDAKFTFQYGATSTRKRMYYRADIYNLHSNMELLLLVLDYFTGVLRAIYIPIWSYFYINPTFGDNCNIIFTFQYGATSTKVML